MIDMDEKTRRQAEALVQAVAPPLGAALETVAPVVQALAARMAKAVAAANSVLRAFVVAMRSPRRRPARKPCAWCSQHSKRPATHTVKWREPVVFEDDHDGPTHWPAGRVMIMCDFHARTARRYNGVTAYRFRRL
jgi:hypothetical protein